MTDIIPIAQGPAKPATAEDLQRDAVGITNPNLHRRIDDTPIEPESEEYLLVDQSDFILCNQAGEELLINFINPFDTSTSTLTLNNRYALCVAGVNSYRTIEHVTHDEESNDSEVP